jgi:hypothetical protein
MTESSLAQRPRMPEGTPDQQARVVKRLNQIPDAQLACRIHHPWPSEQLEFGKPLPEGLTAERTEKQGVWLLEDQCQRCGKIRWKITKPRRVWDTDEGWHYIDPKGLPGYEDWVTLDKDMKRGARTMMGENIRRNASALFR